MNLKKWKKKFPRKLKADEKIPFIAHLEELRYRLIICLIAVGIGFIISYTIKERIFYFLTQPLLKVLPPDQKRLIFTGLLEAFFVYLKLSLFGGILMASPVILYQIWAFVSPGLYNHEKKYIFPFIFFSTFFFIAGASFCFYVVFPFAFRFFIGYGTEHLQAFPSMKEYLSLITRFILAFGIIFEMPVFTFFLCKVGILNHRMLLSQWRYAVVAIFIVAAILTPGPDVISQLLMAGPLLINYFISIWVAWAFGKKERVENGEALEGAELEKG
jgi:sec-independent protein translocase protein TatC